MTARKKTSSKTPAPKTPKLTESTMRKLSLLQLAEEVGNVSKACQIMGYHRDSFYEIRRAFQVGGVPARLEQRLHGSGATPSGRCHLATATWRPFDSVYSPIALVHRTTGEPSPPGA